MFSSCFLKNFAKLVRNNDFGAVGGKKKERMILFHAVSRRMGRNLSHAEWDGMKGIYFFRTRMFRNCSRIIS